MTAKIEKRAVTISVFAEMHGVDRSTVRKAIKNGKLRTITLLNRKLVLLPAADPLPRELRANEPVEPTEEGRAA
jgi:hypothetical protein